MLRFQSDTPTTDFEKFIAGCNEILICPCTNERVRDGFADELAKRAPEGQSEVTLLDLGAGFMWQLLLNSLKLIKAGKKVHAIAIEPRIFLSDKWEQAFDLYLNPACAEINPKVKSCTIKSQSIPGHAVIYKDGYLADVDDGKVGQSLRSLTDELYRSENNEAKPLQAILDGNFQTEADGKLIINETTLPLVKEFFKHYIPSGPMIGVRRKKSLVQQLEVVRNRINEVHGENALKISRFTTVFSYYLACHPERAKIMADRNRFDDTFSGFTRTYPRSIPAKYHSSLLYLACQEDQLLNADLIAHPEVLKLDMAVSVDFTELGRAKDACEQSCFQAILDTNTTFSKQRPVMLSFHRRHHIPHDWSELKPSSAPTPYSTSASLQS